MSITNFSGRGFLLQDKVDHKRDYWTVRLKNNIRVMGFWNSRGHLVRFTVINQVGAIFLLNAR